MAIVLGEERHPLIQVFNQCTSAPATQSTPPMHVMVCERWSGEHGFENFLEDCGLRKPGQTIGRMMDSGDYCKQNARFMSQAEQQGEKRKKRQFIQNTLNQVLRSGPYSQRRKK